MDAGVRNGFLAKSRIFKDVWVCVWGGGGLFDDSYFFSFLGIMRIDKRNNIL